MAIIIIRTIIIYLALLVTMRVLGKRQLGELELSEFVVAALIADLASHPLQDLGIPMINGLVPIFTLFCCEVLITGLSLKSIRLRGFLFGKPSFLIVRGKIDQAEMRKSRFTSEELMQELRKKLGMSIIMITHDLGVVASMCEKIAVMYAGHIVEYGTTDEIFYQPGHEYTKGLINSIPKLNTEVRERLVPIEGTPVDLLNPPAGCPFAPRCKNCMKICLSKMPPRTELSDTHYTYCWLQQKAAFEKGEKAE